LGVSAVSIAARLPVVGFAEAPTYPYACVFVLVVPEKNIFCGEAGKTETVFVLCFLLIVVFVFPYWGLFHSYFSCNSLLDYFHFLFLGLLLFY